MDEAERRRKIEAIMGKHGLPPTHPNCRSIVKMTCNPQSPSWVFEVFCHNLERELMQVALENGTPVPDPDRLPVSWDGLESLLGADTMKRIRNGEET